MDPDVCKEDPVQWITGISEGSFHAKSPRGPQVTISDIFFFFFVKHLYSGVSILLKKFLKIPLYI